MQEKRAFPAKSAFDSPATLCFTLLIARQHDLATGAKGSFTFAQSGYLGATLAACDPLKTREKGLAESRVPSIQSVRPIQRISRYIVKLRMLRCNAPTKQGIRTSKATELPRKPLGTNPSAKPNENKAELPRLRDSLYWIWIEDKGKQVRGHQDAT